MFESGYAEYAWRRLMVISAEDVWGLITHEVRALYDSFTQINQHGKRGTPKGRIFLSKATILLSQARKCRDADHLQNLIYDPKAIPDDVLERGLDEARKVPEAIPDYALDCHTSAGRRAGKTKKDFFREEYQALKPREKGLFDQIIEAL
jgi:replication-associated recombination protein RarA